MKYKKVIVSLFIFIFVVILFICLYILVKDFGESDENNKLIQNLIEKSIDVTEETQEKAIDWEYLKSVNKDIIAWIEIDGTNINYPILKDKNLYYLKHSFNKQSIFTINNNPFEDEETIIYGNNMKNGSMFSSLGKFSDEDFLYSHLKFKIYTQEKNYEAYIFSAYSIGVETENSNVKLLDFDEKIEYYKETSKI